MKAYKLFRKMKDGSLAPLFINQKQRIPVGVWLPAESHRTKGFAYRKGWHCTLTPVAPHLSENGRVWAEVEIEDYEYYNRPESQGGTWVLAQRMKLVRELSGIGSVTNFTTNKPMNLRKLADLQYSLTATDFTKIFGAIASHLWGHFTRKTKGNLLDFYRLLDLENSRRFDAYLKRKGICNQSKSLSGIRKAKRVSSTDIRILPISKVKKGDYFKRVNKNGAVGKKVYQKEAKVGVNFTYIDTADVWSSYYETKTDIQVQVGFEY